MSADADLAVVLEHVGAGRLREAARLAAGLPLGGARTRVLGELATRGHGPLVDALLAARAPDATARERQATAWALARAGFVQLAEEFSGAGDGAPVDGVAAALDDARAARLRHDHAAAVTAGRRARDLAPDADAVQDARAQLHLDEWSAGDPAALAALRAVRDGAGSARAEVELARHALDAIELAGGAAPAWRRAGRDYAGDAATITSGLAAAFGVTIDGGAPPSAAHLRAACAAAGLPSARVVLGRAVLEHVLGRGDVLLVLEEERPVGVGFVVVVGWEPSADLLLLAEPGRAGAAVRAMATQRRRSALGGQGALIVAAAGPTGEAALEVLRAAGIVDDDRLALVDRAHFDPADPDAPHAHVAQLARAAIAAAPDIPMGHRRLGEALIALGRLGRLDDDELPLERWVKASSERFPDAEWPLQIYAQALELWRRWPEALVAWSDAERLDPDDHRNLLGQVRAVREIGGLSGARGRLRQAATLAPRDLDVWCWLAQEELAAGELDAARAAAALAQAVAPRSLELRLLQATLAERAGDMAASLALLDGACAPGEPERGQTVRRFRQHLWDGDSAAMRALVERRLLTAFPGSTSAWSLLIEALLADGQADTAIGAIFGAMQRCPMQGALIDDTVAVLLTCVPPPELADALGAVEARLAGLADPLVRIARGLAYDGGHTAIAVAALERLADAFPGDANAPYSLAQVLVAGGQADDPRVVASLRRALELAPNFPWVRYLLGQQLLARDPGEVMACVEPVVGAAPALFWELQARACERTGDDGAAAQLRARLPEVALGVVEHADFMRRNRLLASLEALTDLAGARPTPHRGLDIERAGLRSTQGKFADAAVLLQRAWDAGPAPWLGQRLVAAHVRAGDAPAAIASAAAVERHITRTSTEAGDPWLVRALAAGANAAAGDGGPRAALLARAGRHTRALVQLVRAEQALGGQLATEDLERLVALAPGAATLVAHEEG
jgi:tetratricopeptide (TPR) repeat protein